MANILGKQEIFQNFLRQSHTRIDTHIRTAYKQEQRISLALCYMHRKFSRLNKEHSATTSSNMMQTGAHIHLSLVTLKSLISLYVVEYIHIYYLPTQRYLFTNRTHYYISLNV